MTTPSQTPAQPGPAQQVAPLAWARTLTTPTQQPDRAPGAEGPAPQAPAEGSPATIDPAHTAPIATGSGTAAVTTEPCTTGPDTPGPDTPAVTTVPGTTEPVATAPALAPPTWYSNSVLRLAENDRAANSISTKAWSYASEISRIAPSEAPVR